MDGNSSSASMNPVRRIAIRPLNRLAGFVVQPDVLHQLATQIGRRGEDAARDDVALNFGEPEFDLIQPGTVGRGEMQCDARVRLQPCVDRFFVL